MKWMSHTVFNHELISVSIGYNDWVIEVLDWVIPSFRKDLFTMKLPIQSYGIFLD